MLILILGAFLITIIFRASVDAQGGAYATGVLVVITSAAVAVTLAASRAGQRRLGGTRDQAEYDDKLRQLARDNDLTDPTT